MRLFKLDEFWMYSLYSETVNNPKEYFDQVIEIDLSTLEPYVNGPFTPDAAHPISEFAKVVKYDVSWKMDVGSLYLVSN